MNKLETEIYNFACERWPNRVYKTRIKKLGEEFGELAEALLKYSESTSAKDLVDIKLEAADLGILLTDLLAILDKSSLAKWMKIKLEIIKERPVTKSKKKHKDPNLEKIIDKYDRN